jgi:RNA polymerase sigma-70 factor, ECF subfamily
VASDDFLIDRIAQATGSPCQCCTGVIMSGCSGSGSGSFGTRFMALSALRRRKDAEPDDEAADAIEDTSDDPEVTVQKKDTSDALRRCLGGLSAEHREIVDLVYYRENSVEEVAGIIGLPENTVKTRLFYARKKLAELLEAAGIERGWP